MKSMRFDHQIGAQLSSLQQRAIKEAYLTFYELAGADLNDHFIFTSSGAESVNHAVFSTYLDITRKTGKNHFLCGSLDEAPTIMAMGRLQEMGCLFQMIPASAEGYITDSAFVQMVCPRTAMLSLSCANALTGVVQPLKSIAEICKDRGILFHIEATHVLGKTDFNFKESGADVMTFNGPQGGMGGIFIRNGIEISPLILGGREQGEMRGGGVCIPSLIECAKWAKQEMSYCDHTCIEVARLKSIFEEAIISEYPKAKVLFKEQHRVPHITAFLFPNIVNDLLFYALTQKGLYCTYGGNHLQHMVHILKSCGIQTPDCHTGLSFAFPSDIAEEEIQGAALVVAETAFSLQRYSEHLVDKYHGL